MGRKNKNARKIQKIDYGRFARDLKFNPIQRVKTAKLIMQILKEGVEVK
jgi:hypothetical protein